MCSVLAAIKTYTAILRPAFFSPLRTILNILLRVFFLKKRKPENVCFENRNHVPVVLEDMSDLVKGPCAARGGTRVTQGDTCLPCFYCLNIRFFLKKILTTIDTRDDVSFGLDVDIT